MHLLREEEDEERVSAGCTQKKKSPINRNRKKQRECQKRALRLRWLTVKKKEKSKDLWRKAAPLMWFNSGAFTLPW